MNRKKNTAPEEPTAAPERALEGERLLTVEETAQALGLCLDSVRRHLRSGKLQGVRVGRSWRIPQRNLLAQLGVGMAALGAGLGGGDEETVHRRSTFAGEANSSVPSLHLSSPPRSSNPNEQDVALALLKSGPLRERVRDLVAQATDNADLSSRSTERLLAELDDLLA